MCRFFFLVLLSVYPLQAQITKQDSIEASAPEGAITASVTLSPHTVPLNRTLTLTLQVTWQGDLDRFEVSTPTLPEMTNLQVVSNASSNWVGQKQGKTMAVRTYKFTLAPEELGMAYIDEIMVEYKDLQMNTSQSLTTNRVEAKVVDPILERDWRPVLEIGLLFLSFAALIFSLWFYFRRRKKRLMEMQKAVENESPVEEHFLAQLKERVDLKSDKIADGCAVVSSLLRKYIAEKYGLQALGMSTPEIASGLMSTEIASQHRGQIEEILQVCDVAKFSGDSGARATLERIYTLFENILEANLVGSMADAEENNQNND